MRWPWPIKEKFASLFEDCFPKELPRLRPGKPRIGFVATRSREAGFLRTMSGIIEGLDGKRFEPVVLCAESGLEVCRKAIRRSDITWVPFPDRFTEAAKRIRAAECQVLYHRHIGSDPFNYFLPFVRLAPVQCTSWGTHVTSGIRAVDYYLTGRLREPERAQDQYTETLHCFDVFPEWQPRIPELPTARRSDFGLPERGNMYLCPPRLAKFHPDQDPLLRGVLESDPEGFVVLLGGRYPYAAEVLRRRCQRTLAGVLERVIFLPPQKPIDFYRLLSVADVMLDTVHYSASLMSYDAFAVGLPIVTLPDEFNVGRYTLGFYRKMEIDQLIARSPEEFVTIATRMGRERNYREHFRARIAERRDVFFENPQLVREHEKFFEQALSRAQQAER